MKILIVSDEECPALWDYYVPGRLSGYDLIISCGDLKAEYLMFQGEPFQEEDYCEAIQAVQQAMDGYDPTIIGYRWDDENPRIQLEPRGERGYIELRAVKRMEQLKMPFLAE